LPDRVPWIRVSRAYVSTLAIGLSPFVLVAIANFFFQPLAGAIILVALAGAVATRWLAWTRTGYAIDGDRLLVRTGWWKRRITILPARKIQSVDLRESFVSRVFGIASLQFGVAGGGLTGHSIPAIPRGEARKLRDRLLDFGS
jgi:putative membrane protein